MTKGIYPRENSIQIYFSLSGKAYRETLTGVDGDPLPPTPKNIAYAAKIREQILRAIAMETFKLEEFFPHSRTAVAKASKQSEKVMSVKEAVEAWLHSRSKTVEETSMRAYRSTIRPFVKRFGKRNVASLTFSDIDGMMSDLAPHYAPNTYNSILSEVKTFYRYAVRAHWATGNPASEVATKRRPEPAPDPLTHDEVEVLLKDMRLHYHPQIANYYALAILIGCRPSEMIDLRWSNVDWKRRVILVNSARVWGIQKGTKTHKNREIELGDESLAVLKHQQLLTGEHDHGRIFDNPYSDAMWYQPSKLHQEFWKPSLQRCGIRFRDSRQTRHTCASFLLMRGYPPAWAAGQMGHSVQMFCRVYAKWINGADKGAHRKDYESFMASIIRGAETCTGSSLDDVSA